MNKSFSILPLYAKKNLNFLDRNAENVINRHEAFFYLAEDSKPLHTFKFNIQQMTRSHKPSQLLFILTEKCKLRCEKCNYWDTYQKEKGFSDEEVNFNKAKKAIDLYTEILTKRLKHGIMDTPVICFWGILKFDLIQKTIEYAKTQLPDSLFSVTANNTLLTGKMIDYFIENNVVFTFNKKMKPYFCVVKKALGVEDPLLSLCDPNKKRYSM
jgi:hypothetical protein